MVDESEKKGRYQEAKGELRCGVVLLGVVVWTRIYMQDGSVDTDQSQPVDVRGLQGGERIARR